VTYNATGEASHQSAHLGHSVADDRSPLIPKSGSPGRGLLSCFGRASGRKEIRMREEEPPGGPRSVRRGSLLLAALAVLSLGSLAHGDDMTDMLSELTAEPKGSLMIIGGFERVDNDKIWSEFIEL